MFKNWKILVIGAGTMGHSIAQKFAVNGFETTLTDQSEDQLKLAKKMITNNLATLVDLSEITKAEADKAEKMIIYETGFDKTAPDADLVVETIIENPDAKRALYNTLDKLCKPDCIFTSNTSALNIFEIAKEISHPERLIIAHWFNPPHIMPLVEVVIGSETSPETVDKVKNILLQIGKIPAIIKQYIPGFIINRLSVAIAREACHMIDQGWTTAEDIDAAIISTFGPRYPFEGHMELLDHVGWDVAKAVASFIHPQLCNSTGGNPVADDFVAKGFLGIKSGRGIKDYSNVDISELQQKRNIKIIKMLKAVKSLNA